MGLSHHSAPVEAEGSARARRGARRVGERMGKRPWQTLGIGSTPALRVLDVLGISWNTR